MSRRLQFRGDVSTPSQCASTRALLGRDFGEIVGRHRVGQHRLHADRRREGCDMLGRIEQHALRRFADPLPHRFRRVAHRAARLHDVDDLVRAPSARRARRRCGGVAPSRAARACPAKRPSRSRTRPDRERRDEPGPPRRLVVVGVPDIVEVADQRAGDDDAGHDRGNDARVGEGHGIVVRQHHEQHGQRDVVVVGRALLGGLRPSGIGRLAGEERGDRFALVGHDDEEDVGGHHRRHQRAGVDQRAAAGERQRESVARQDDITEADEREQRVVPGERRLAKRS